MGECARGKGSKVWGWWHRFILGILELSQGCGYLHPELLCPFCVSLDLMMWEWGRGWEASYDL